MKVHMHMRHAISGIAAVALMVAMAGCSAGGNGGYTPSKKARDLNNKAVAALNQKDNERALMLINEAIALEPEFYGAYANKSAILTAMGREPEAIDALKAVISIKQDYVDAYVPLALLLERTGKAEEAKALYGQTIALYDAQLQKTPDSPDMAVNRAVAVYLNGDAQQALLALKDVLGKHPENKHAAAIRRRIEKGTREAFVAGMAPAEAAEDK